MSVQTKKIRLLGETLYIRTDVDDSKMDALVKEAEDRLSLFVSDNSNQQMKEVLVAFLALLGEFLEEEKQSGQLRRENQKILENTEKLVSRFEKLDI